MLTFCLRVAHQLVLGSFSPQGVVAGTKRVTAPFRCYPLDLDVFGHMNNANYIRVAELARWRMLTESGLFSYMLKKRLMFLLVEQTVTYARPIMPFQSYKIQTSIKVCSEDKWVYYTHIFEEANPSSSSEPPKQYARIDAKTVMKLSNGKTVKPSEVSAINPYYRNLTEMK